MSGITAANPFAMSPPGASLPNFPGLVPPSPDVSEGENYPPLFGFVGPSIYWADPPLALERSTYPEIRGPTIFPPGPGAAIYRLLGPGQTPGFSPTPTVAENYPPPIEVAPGLFPWWQISTEEEQTSQYFYLGMLGYDSTFFYTSLCPNCDNVHKTMAPPLPTPAGPVLIIPCYSGTIPGPVFVPFYSQPPNTDMPQAVLLAIAQGKIVAS